MPRHHAIWDASQQKQINVPFTAEEETAKDAEEQAWTDGATDRAWEELRTKRNKLLVETDWYSFSDVTMPSNMKTYRQELRDLPANTSDPVNPTWPTKPE
tara:strand:+ start:528 stop:827 length:300 start_codon:yes stop_codon:yes gene_type:complete